MAGKYQFNRRELAGSLGDLGTILPLALGMIMVNGLSAGGVFFSVGLFYIATGVYYGITVPVQPMKVIGAYAIATAMSPEQIMASSALMSITLLTVGMSGTIDLIGKYTPRSVIRGVQLSTGLLLMTEGIRMMAGTSKIQMIYEKAEPWLSVQMFGPVSIGILIGAAGSMITLALLDNKKIPAGIVIVAIGFIVGIMLGSPKELMNLRPGFNLPDLLPFGFPKYMDYTFAAFALVLPQMPMTLGNAVIANADLSNIYFKEKSGKMTYKSLCLSMAAGNVIGFLFGGMPMCHGAGGLSAHYRFGARTAGSNLMIGSFLILLVIITGDNIFNLLSFFPMSILGVLLVFSGSQLVMTIQDVNKTKDYFVIACMIAITLAGNLAYAFAAGTVLAYLLKSERFNV